MVKWSIEERIAHKEYRISLTKDLIHTMEGIPGFDKKYIKQHHDKIEDLKKSIEHDRQVQKIEAAKSGRREWWHNPMIYAGIYFGGIATAKIIEIMYDILI